MFFSFLPSEALFPAAFFSSAEAFSPAVLSFPGRSLFSGGALLPRPEPSPDPRAGKVRHPVRRHRSAFPNKFTKFLQKPYSAPPPNCTSTPIFCRRRLPARSATPRFTPKPPSPATPDPSSPPPSPAPRLRPPEHPHRPPATRPHRSPLPDTRHPASSPMPPKLLSAHSPPSAATFVSSSCRNHTPTRPRPRRLSCRLPHHRPPAAAHRPGGRPMPPPSPFRLPPFSASPSFLPPPSAVTTVVSPSSRRRRLLTSPATAPPPHPLLSKKEEPTRPLFPTKSLSLQNMDGPPAKNARKRGLLPAPFRIFAHLYPRHARKTG